MLELTTAELFGIIGLVLLGCCVFGFIGQWLFWEVFPFWKDKRKAKKLAKKNKKVMKNT